MDTTTVNQPAAVEGPSPRKQRRIPKKQRDEVSDLSATENRHPDANEQPSDLRSDTPPQQIDDAKSVVENLTGSNILPSAEGRPTPNRPSNRSISRSKHSSSDPQRARVANLVSRGFAGQAPELLEAVEECEACFPCCMPEQISLGLKHPPGAEMLQDLLHQAEMLCPQNMNTTMDADVGSRNPDAIRDTIFAGALMGSSEILEACLKNGADLTVSNVNGRNIFHCLAAKGDAGLLRKVLRRIVKTHGRVEERKATSGSCPGTPPDKTNFTQLINQVDHRGWTPLLTAVARCNEDVVEGILSYPQVNLETQLAHTCPPHRGTDPVHSCAIHLAAIRCHIGIAKRLISHGASLVGGDSSGRNAFHYAAAARNIEQACTFFDAMSKEAQFDPQMLMEVDHDERSPIFAAIAWGNIALAERMVHHAKTAALPAQGEIDQERHFSLTECVLRRDRGGLTALHVAHMRRHFGVLFRVPKLWAMYRTAEDPDTLLEALKSRDAVETEPSMNVFKVLAAAVNDKTHAAKWLEADLDCLERATYATIRCTLMECKNPNTPPDHQLLKAIRRLGSEFCLRACSKALEALDRSVAGLPRGPGQKRSPSETAFYRTVRELVLAECSPTEARSALTFIIGENFNKAFSSGGPTERPNGAHSGRTFSGQATRRGAEKHLPRANREPSSYMSRGSGFAAPLTGASPRTNLNQSSAIYQSSLRSTPDRTMTDRKAGQVSSTRTSPPHMPQVPQPPPSSGVGGSKHPRGVTVKAGGSPSFMSMTRSSANLIRAVTGPRVAPAGKSGVADRPAQAAPVRVSQQGAAKQVHRLPSKRSTGVAGNAGANANAGSRNVQRRPSGAPEDFEAPRIASGISFESNSESRSIQAA